MASSAYLASPAPSHLTASLRDKENQTTQRAPFLSQGLQAADLTKETLTDAAEPEPIYSQSFRRRSKPLAQTRRELPSQRFFGRQAEADRLRMQDVASKDARLRVDTKFDVSASTAQSVMSPTCGYSSLNSSRMPSPARSPSPVRSHSAYFDDIWPRILPQNDSAFVAPRTERSSHATSFNRSNPPVLQPARMAIGRYERYEVRANAQGLEQHTLTTNLIGALRKITVKGNAFVHYGESASVSGALFVLSAAAGVLAKHSIATGIGIGILTAVLVLSLVSDEVSPRPLHQSHSLLVAAIAAVVGCALGLVLASSSGVLGVSLSLAAFLLLQLGLHCVSRPRDLEDSLFREWLVKLGFDR